MNIAEKIKEWINNPVGFVREVFGAQPTFQQEQLLVALAKREHNSFAVRSGHGCGKSACLAWLMIWFLITRPQSKVICTAPTKRQLKDILWAETSFWISKAISVVKELIEIYGERIKVGGREDWFARAVSINIQASPEEQAETLAGIHAKHLLVVVDEASGVPEPVFLPIEGYLTNKDNFVILTGNPTRPHGYFYKVFNNEDFGEDWCKLHWNSEESPIVSRQWVEKMERRYGRESDTYRIRVLGDFPRSGVQDLIPREWIERNIISSEDAEKASVIKPIIWGIDPAGMGGDEVGFVKRTGTVLYDIKGKPFMEQDEIIDWIMEDYEKASTKPDYVCIDISGGYGTAISERLRALLPLKETKVFGIHFGWRANNPDNFVLLRDELWWKTRELFEFNLLKIKRDDQLIRQLSSIKYRETDSGKIKVESKKKIREKQGGSPDRAEALILTTYLEVPSIVKYPEIRRKRRRKRTRRVDMWKVA